MQSKKNLDLERDVQQSHTDCESQVFTNFYHIVSDSQDQNTFFIYVAELV